VFDTKFLQSYYVLEQGFIFIWKRIISYPYIKLIQNVINKVFNSGMFAIKVSTFIYVHSFYCRNHESVFTPHSLGCHTHILSEGRNIDEGIGEQDLRIFGSKKQ